QNALDQVELADKLGIDNAWEVEHHFLEEYSHSSAPEVFLAACSQRTKNIRLGHGITLMPPNYNHPARVAERIATLDLVSNGRVEWGTGESSALLELGGYPVPQYRAQAGAAAASAALGRLLQPRDHQARGQARHRRAHLRLRRSARGQAMGRRLLPHLQGGVRADRPCGEPEHLHGVELLGASRRRGGAAARPR